MAYQFKTQRVTTPLFGSIQESDDAKREPWRVAFATGKAGNITITDQAFEWLAEELELDAEGLAIDAQRYVQGKYRVKAKGLSGGRLGDLGEALSYLAERALGHNIVRVLNADTGGKVKLKGQTYCYPDFIVQAGAKLHALEVKSTEALDFQAMVLKRAQPKLHMKLAPCKGAEAGREEALAQLGHGSSPSYKLKLKKAIGTQTSVPFPVGKGVAMSVMPVDGRAKTIWEESAFRTPPACRKNSRDCKTCVGDAEVLMTRMPNAPDHLPLMGHGDQDMGEWFLAYQRWTQALLCHDAIAARHALGTLAGPLDAWVETLEDTQQESALRFWGLHLHKAMRQRGLNADGIPMLPDIPDEYTWPEDEIQQAAPPAELLDHREFQLRAQSALIEGSGQGQLICLRPSPVDGDKPQQSWTLRVQPRRIDLFYMSRHWWRREAVRFERQAAEIARDALAFWTDGLTFRAPDADDLIIEQVTAQVGENSVQLGWAFRDWSSWRQPWWPWLWDLHGKGLHHDVGIRITPDGRAQLTLRRPT